ncbi:MAG: MgtC/SapB family protein [Gammaproteobacteria bacterium]|nr:MgtC/SapB family protein [Gammaproteobacteria bacterium]MCW5583970.1 MgtC/SapB family protein [Gammaproteobacteria bacterium]
MIPYSELILRLLLAALLGSAIGLERERLLWAAGLRTHMLVCTGSCLIMIVSAFGFSDILGTADVQLDPSRIAAQVVSGIGFLGAGAILLRGDIVRGLTTAASVWAVAGIGLAVGGGLYAAAVSATVIILIILAGIKPLEEKFKTRRNNTWVLMLSVKHGQMSMDLLQQTIKSRTSYVRQFIVQPTDKPEIDQVTIVLTRISRLIALEIVAQLKNLSCVIDVKENN